MTSRRRRAPGVAVHTVAASVLAPPALLVICIAARIGNADSKTALKKLNALKRSVYRKSRCLGRKASRSAVVLVVATKRALQSLLRSALGLPSRQAIRLLCLGVVVAAEPRRRSPRELTVHLVARSVHTRHLLAPSAVESPRRAEPPRTVNAFRSTMTHSLRSALPRTENGEEKVQRRDARAKSETSRPN